MTEPVRQDHPSAAHLGLGVPPGSGRPQAARPAGPLTCEDADHNEEFIRMLIHFALQGERITGASEEGGFVTTADEKSDPFHVPLPVEVPAAAPVVPDGTGIPEGAPPLPSKAPYVPAQTRPAASTESLRPVRAGRGDDWWTKGKDPNNPWASPTSLTPQEDDETAGQSREPAPVEDEPGREHSRGEREETPVIPGPIVKEPADEDSGQGSVTAQVREAFAPVAAELRELRGRFARPYEPSDDAVENGKRLRWMRIRRYGIPLGVALIPLPPTLPGVGDVVGGYSLAAMYASIPQSLQVSSGWSLGWAAVAALAPTCFVVLRFARHLKARRKPGFTLRIVTSAMVCGSVMYGPVGAYVLYLMNGHIA
ncbi:hypothetical protein OG883_43130 [Streptomyces sp. NBC_01142]|uniref:hypothetical protein n=1 Tax=Streptomyces sp. NBC_01142 TaxID=2975865 RepID=UPI0022522565|nr:hypothetical protein [Streptomyces sp. NBC_01142]MCX4826436.1 hypothetical protein [Streptomyces sp. NBC_01142]